MMPNFNLDNNVFPDRKDLRKSIQTEKAIYDDIVDQAKKLNVEKINFDGEDFVPRAEIKQKQRVFFWIRVYLKEEINIELNTDVNIIWKETEKITTKFICYAKKGHEKNAQENVVNYNPEDDKRILCLMVDADRIDKHSDDIPFIRTLFKISRWYQPQILRLSEIKITDSNERDFEFYDIDF